MKIMAVRSQKASHNFDVIIVGAGSIGTPSALFLAKGGLKVLVIDQLPSVGQASNKHAIGGIRATHSDPAKIYIGTRSLEHFSRWQEVYGDDIEWYKGGYSFVAYRNQEVTTLKDLLTIQHDYGLNIDWYDQKELLEIIPDLNSKGLMGGTYSPDDGSASPLRSAYAFFRKAQEFGAEFHFSEKAINIYIKSGKIVGIETNKGKYSCNILINAAGAWARKLSALAGVEIPVRPDAHEAGITEPVQKLFDPMIVDIRPGNGSSNFYFYQHPTGKIIFCVTPSPQIWGNLSLATSEFLPMAAKRLIDIMPKLKNIRVRRTWRGTYPMTPDGSPIVGKINELDGYILAVGMCGQGFMLGPGIGELLTNMILERLNKQEIVALDSLSLDREFAAVEQLK